MVDIKCLVCGESLEIPPYIDTDNYDGQLNCHKCNSLLYIKLVSSKVRKYRVVEKNTQATNIIKSAFPERKYPTSAQGDIK